MCKELSISSGDFRLTVSILKVWCDGFWRFLSSLGCCIFCYFMILVSWSKIAQLQFLQFQVHSTKEIGCWGDLSPSFRAPEDATLILAGTFCHQESLAPLHWRNPAQNRCSSSDSLSWKMYWVISLWLFDCNPLLKLPQVKFLRVKDQYFFSRCTKYLNLILWKMHLFPKIIKLMLEFKKRFVLLTGKHRQTLELFGASLAWSPVNTHSCDASLLWKQTMWILLLIGEGVCPFCLILWTLHGFSVYTLCIHTPATKNTQLNMSRAECEPVEI